MNVVNINIQKVTFAELTKALHDLNFKQENEGDRSRFFHKKNDTIVMLKKERGNKIVDRIHLIGTAIILEGKGIIKNIDFLAQLIKKNRLIERNKINE